ncbi:rhomboid-like protein [Streptomyces sp. NPDC052042]|uniref:rhomboid-like protein n=1 Tax=Streptomyces sp. NPDC052042 TaxID=3365683 RepID=UPI0037D7F528
MAPSSPAPPTRPRSTAGSWLRDVGSWIRSAPGTYVWLAALFVTTVIIHQMSPAFEEEFLRQRSTNIHELSQDPVRVLIASAFWIDNGRWAPYVVLYTIFHARAERWLGTLRWLAVAAAAHVLATLVSEGVLAWAIRHGHVAPAAANTLDVGVSYALAGVIAVLTYRVPAPWRPVYPFAVLVFYGIPLVTGPGFTDLGHFAAVLIGLACRPLIRSRLHPGGRPDSRPGKAARSRSRSGQRPRSRFRSGEAPRSRPGKTPRGRAPHRTGTPPAQ